MHWRNMFHQWSLLDLLALMKYSIHAHRTDRVNRYLGTGPSDLLVTGETQLNPRHPK